MIWFKEYPQHPVVICQVMRLKVTIIGKLTYIADLLTFFIRCGSLFLRTMARTPIPFLIS